MAKCLGRIHLTSVGVVGTDWLVEPAFEGECREFVEPQYEDVEAKALQVVDCRKIGKTEYHLHVVDRN